MKRRTTATHAASPDKAGARVGVIEARRLRGVARLEDQVGHVVRRERPKPCDQIGQLLGRIDPARAFEPASQVQPAPLEQTLTAVARTDNT